MAGRKPSVEAREVVKAIALHPEPVVTASDINEEIGLSVPGARERLKSLVADGYVDMKRAGSSALVFWNTDKGWELLRDACDC